MIDDRQKQIISEFNSLSNWEDRYKKIIEIGKAAPEIPEQYKKDDNLVKGCQSKVWMFAQVNEEGKMVIHADSDAMIVRGLVSLLVKVFSEENPKTIMTTEPYFINEIGLSEHLSPTRTNGLVSMIKQIKFYAMAYAAKAN
jgi:cysteine desulfuration protein SufE